MMNGNAAWHATEAARVQREAARARANYIRMSRAALKRRVRDGEVSVAEILEDPPEYARGMKISALLLALPHVGHHRVRKLLRGICGEDLTLDRLSEYTRGRVIERVERILNPDGDLDMPYRRALALMERDAA